MPPADRPRAAARPTPEHQEEMRTLLRGGTPSPGVDEATAAAILKRYECGGWLHVRRGAPGSAPLPEPWRTAAARAHRKTVVDSLVALGVAREVTALLAAAGIPVVLLKGAAYLGDLYADPGERPLTDVDLLVAPRDVASAAARLQAAGFGVVETPESPHVAEYRRFEMGRPGPAPCRVEVHWQVGTGGRMQFDQAALWARARETAIQGAACRVLEAHDALLYHVGHAAEHYFGPSLKWTLDLRAMFEAWRPDPVRLVEIARAARVRVALALALRQLEDLLPGAVPGGLSAAAGTGPLRRFLLDRLRPEGPLEFLPWSSGEWGRPLLRPLLFDTPLDAITVSGAVLARRWNRRHAPPPDRPWEAARDEASAATGGPAVD